MSRIPYIEFYAEDFLSGVRNLSDGERGTYITLLAMMWSDGHDLGDDDAWLARMCNVSTRMFKKHKKTLVDSGKLTIIDGRILNERALKTHEKAVRLHRKFVESGAKGGRKRAENIAKIAEVSHSVSSPPSFHASSPPSSNQNHNHIEKKKTILKKASQIPMGWEPNDDLISSIADKHSCSKQAVSKEVYNFVNYWLGEGKAKKDWNATFRIWCAKSYCPIHTKNKSALSEKNGDFKSDEERINQDGF